MFFKLVKNSRLQLCLVLVLGFIFRLFHFISTPIPLNASDLIRYYPDENVYYNMSELIKTKGLFGAFISEQSLWTAPLNSFYIYLLSGVTSQPILFIRLVNIVISVLTIFIVYKIGVKTFNVRVGVFAAFFVAIYYPIIEISPTLLTEPLYMFLLFLGIYYLLKERDSQSIKQLILSALLLGLSTLTRSMLLIAPLFICLTFYDNRLGKKIFVKKSLIYLFVFFIVISPVITKNYLLFNKLSISNGSGAALYLGSRPDTEGDEPPYRGKDYQTLEITTPYTHLESEGDTRLQKVAMNNIRNNFMEYIYWDVKKVGRLLVGNQYYWFFPYGDLIGFSKSEGLTATFFKVFNMLLAIVVAVFGLFNLIKLVLKKNLTHPLILLIMYHIVFSLPFLVNPRYGLPVVCLLSVFMAAYFLNRNKERL
ncbi:glycosyltransferase family 39 protein [Paenibacillus sp. FSL M7-1455]|uniref:ArnT family glycosyltransferase n=1 Tax=Paenibacillus sp. FSL M7-1455 TaxID=2975316 RepID=UPI0030FA4CFC